MVRLLLTFDLFQIWLRTAAFFQIPICNPILEKPWRALLIGRHMRPSESKTCCLRIQMNSVCTNMVKAFTRRLMMPIISEMAMYAYIDIIYRNTLAMVPKVIYFCMINEVKVCAWNYSIAIILLFKNIFRRDSKATCVPASAVRSRTAFSTSRKMLWKNEWML